MAGSAQKAQAPSPKRKATDWEAIERDHATGKYTDAELGKKHKTARESICRKRAAEQKKDPRRWQKDLSEQVRAATQALLVHAEVTKQVTEAVTAGHTVTAVMVAAEIGKDVILAHRHELRAARALAMELLQEVQAGAQLAEHKELLAQVLAGSGATPADEAKARQAVQRALDTGSRVTSAKNLADTLTKLHAGERVAFALSDDDGDDAKSKKSGGTVFELPDEELVADILERRAADRAKS